MDWNIIETLVREGDLLLYHFSEDANIEIFEPRMSASKPELPPMVWAINEERMINYFFPRDCPRIIYSKNSDVSEADQTLFFSHTKAKTIITVENAWFERILKTRIYKYIFDPKDFELIDETAGYYISHNVIKPVGMEVVDHLLMQLLTRGVDLRFTPSLHPLKDVLLKSTINDFSIIRFRNASNGLERCGYAEHQGYHF